MSDPDLFGDERRQNSKCESKARVGRVRVQRAERNQVELRASSLDEALPDEHRARVIWDALEDLDLSAFYEPVGSREGSAGRPAIDPRILVALWLYATCEGVGSARELERLCSMHAAYRWMCGGVSVNYHTLSDFRVGHSKALDDLMTQILGALMSDGLLRLRRVAQDGMRVRGHAGAASYRRGASLKECLREAKKHVQTVKKQLGNDGGRALERHHAARRRAAEEREARVRKALRKLEQLNASKPAKEAAETRVSTTDPECRVMKMADGGWRPAWNIQLATDVESRAIVGVRVIDKGNDQGQIEPMLEEIGRRTEKLPKDLLVDGGFAKLESIERAAEAGVTVYAPLQRARRSDVDPAKPKKNDGPGVAAWRERMGTERALAIYKDRATIAEGTNADLRTWRGLDRISVNGAAKVLCVVLWSTLAFNLMRLVELTT
jgi:transposase